MTDSTEPRPVAGRTSWPYFNTPGRVFFAVISPICALMAPLAVVAPQGWMRWTAAGVLACSAYAGFRGFACRLAVDEAGVSYRSPWRTIHLPWEQIRRIDRYTIGIGGIGYVFISTRDTAPAGRWDVDATTVQIQDRPGLLEALRVARDDHAKQSGGPA